MTSPATESHKPLAAGLFGVQDQPALEQRDAVPTATARCFAQLFAASEGANEQQADKPKPRQA